MPVQPDGYTFVLSDEVTRTPVRYGNRYGIEIAADLYIPKDLDETLGHAAIVVGPPARRRQGTGLRRVRAGARPPGFRRDRLRLLL